jgi:hypothetical protein
MEVGVGQLDIFTRHVVLSFGPLHRPSTTCAVSYLISQASILISPSRLHYTTAMIPLQIAESKALHEKIVQGVGIFLKTYIYS